MEKAKKGPPRSRRNGGERGRRRARKKFMYTKAGFCAIIGGKAVWKPPLASRVRPGTDAAGAAPPPCRGSVRFRGGALPPAVPAGLPGRLSPVFQYFTAGCVPGGGNKSQKLPSGQTWRDRTSCRRNGAGRETDVFSLSRPFARHPPAGPEGGASPYILFRQKGDSILWQKN